jgi:hypothetical protein
MCRISPPKATGVCKPSTAYSNLEIPYKSYVKFLGIKITENKVWIINTKSICLNLNMAFFVLRTECFYRCYSGSCME